MPALQFWNGSLLFRGGLLAMDPACCCTDTPVSDCCCPDLDPVVEPPSPPPDLTVTISSTCAAMDGKTFTLEGSGDETHCQVWTGQVNIGNCPGAPVILNFVMKCLTTGGGCSQYVISVNPNNSACANEAKVDDVPVDADCSCDPVYLVFSDLPAPFKNPLDMSGECDCCVDADTYTLTVTL